MQYPKLTYYIIFIISQLFLSMGLCTYAIEPVTPTVLSFLINANEHISLELSVPSQFTPIVGQDKLAEAIKTGLIEFIPKNTENNAEKWSELLSVMILNNTSVQAHTFRDSVLGGLKAKTTEFTMLNSAFKNEKEYQVATAIARYQLESRTEILYFYAISGPVNAVSIQYIKSISPKEDIPQLLTKLGAFFAQHIKIVK